MKTFTTRLLFILCLAVSGPSLWSQSSGGFTANRTTGVAPLSVFFDASGAFGTEEGTFHNYDYRWDFGDDPDAVWATSGKPKNKAFGPVAAHVFEQPGTYQVVLSVHNSTGQVLTDAVTITVTDPDVVFAGTATKCVSSTGDFAGCPAGSQQLMLSNFSDIASHLASGSRILLRRGETWDVNGTLVIGNVENVTFGAFGGGEKPRLVANDSRSVIAFMSDRQNANWRITDMVMQSPGDVSRTPAMYPGDQLLLMNVEIEGFVGMVQGGRVGSDKKENLFIVDSHLHHIRGALDLGALGNAVYMGGREMAVMGSTLEHTERGEHVIRITETVGTVISHNILRNPGAGRHIIKLHARCFTTLVSGESCASSREYTENVVISDNQISGELNDWDVVVGPQSAQYDEAVRKVLVERNHFTTNDTESSTSVVICASDVTVRNNVFQNLGTHPLAGAHVMQRGIEAQPNNVFIYNNTIVTDLGKTTLAIVEEGTNINMINNLLVGSTADSLTILSGPVAGSANSSHNLTSTDFNIFQNGANFPFNLADGGVLVDGGTAVPVASDYNGQSRPMGAGYDIGAYESGGTGGTQDTSPPSAPANVQVANLSTTSLDLSWSASTDNVGVTHYQVELITGPTVVDVITATGTSVSLTGLTPGTQYQFGVTAFDAAGNQSAAGVATAVTLESGSDTTPPTVPANLTATNITETSVTLSWDPATDNDVVDHYELFQDGASTPVVTVLAANPATTDITGLTAATAYSFTIRAVDAAGNASALSAPVAVTTSDASGPDTELPSTPANLQVVGVTSGTVSLSWDPSTDNVGVTGYNVYQKDVPAPVATVTGTSAVVSGLSPSTFYKFKVAALDQAGNESLWSSAVDATTLSADAPGDTIPPAAPANERIVNIDYTSMDVLWDASSDNVGVAYYQIVVIDATETPDTVDVITTTTTSLSFTALTPDRFYQYWLTAFDAAGNESLNTFAGAFATDAIPPTVPQNVMASNVTENSVTLSWDPATDNNVVSHYEVFQNDDFSPLITVEAENDPQVVITGLTPSTNYTFAVRTRDGENNASALSAPGVVNTATPSIDTIPPTRPSYVKVANVDFTSLDLSWGASTDNVGVAYYQIELIDETEGPYDTLGIITTTDTAIFLTDLFDGTFYQFRVTAFDEAGNQSDDVRTVAFTTDQIPPTMPANLVASNIAESSVTLSWDHATDNRSMELYEIFLDGALSPIASIFYTDSATTITGLTPATTYSFTIRAVDWNWNTSAESDPLIVTTAASATPDTEQPATPANLQVIEVTSSSISLSWDSSTDNIGVTGYNVYQWGISGPVSTVSGTNVVISGLSPSTYYKFKVTALDQAGNESWQTSAVDATTASALARQSADTEMDDDEGGVVSLYPNPATSVIHLVTDHQPDETTVIKMTDLSGKEVQSWSRQGSTHTLDVSAFDRGIYLIRISGSKSFFQRVILR